MQRRIKYNENYVKYDTQWLRFYAYHKCTRLRFQHIFVFHLLENRIQTLERLTYAQQANDLVHLWLHVTLCKITARPQIII